MWAAGAFRVLNVSWGSPASTALFMAKTAAITVEGNGTSYMIEVEGSIINQHRKYDTYIVRLKSWPLLFIFFSSLYKLTSFSYKCD